METVYLDSLFLLELGLDYLLCLCAGRLCGLVLRRKRYFAAALFGALYSALSYLPALAFFSLPLMKLVSGFALCLIAYGNERAFFRCTLVFFAVSAAFGGILWALSLSGFRPALDIRALFLSFSLIYALMRFVLGQRANTARREHAEATIKLGERHVTIRLLIDSGNCLADPISGKGVLVASPHALAALLGGNEKILELEGTDFVEAAAHIPELSGRTRLIPYSSVGGSGLLAAFAPDRVCIGTQDKELLVALSKSACGEGFDGIL